MPGPDDNSVVLIDAQGTARAMSPDAAAAALAGGGGWRLQTDDDIRARADEAAREKTYGGTRGIVGTAATSVAGGLTLGLSDAAIAAAGGAEDLKGLRRQNPTTHTVGTVAGAVVGSVAAPGSALARTPAGLASGVGRAAAAGEATGALGRAALAARGAAAEGAIAGVGQGVSELALSDDPLSVARVASVLGSNALYGAGLGAVAGGGGKLAAEGLEAASGALGRGAVKLEERAAALRGAPSDVAAVGDDLAKLDKAGLRAARAAELEAIEASRVAQRASLAEEIGAFRASTKESKLFLTTKGADAADLRVLGKRTLKADRQLDQLLDNPKALAQRPERALAALQQQESALEEIMKRRESLAQSFAGDASGARAAALDAIPAALERNRVLQARMAELTTAAASPRLNAIQAAEDALSSARPAEAGIGQQMLQGGTYSTVASMVGGIPVVGSILGPLVAARASSAVGSAVFGQIGKAAGEAAQRAAAAAAKFATGAAKAAELGGKSLAAPTSTRALRAAVFAASATGTQPDKPAAPAPTSTGDELLMAYQARTRELRSQVAPDLATGRLVVRPAARTAISTRLQPVRESSPLLADRLETHAVRRLEYLANKMPKRPDVGLPDSAARWAPAPYEMRSWARAVSAVDDPHGALERMADTLTISPDEAEALRAVHPKLVDAHVRAVIDEAAKAGKTLGYRQRMALTILSGTPVEPLMRQPTLALLQSTYTLEPGSAGGTQAPRPQPQFGSVKAEGATRAQERAG